MARWFVVVLVAAGCSASRVASGPLLFEAAAPRLEQNHFVRDRGGLSAEALDEILSAPVFLEAGARIGVVPVATGYVPDGDVPVEGAPATLVSALEGSGLVELATEISSEWPVDSGTAGLRELAARYRSEYLLLYRHRFLERVRPNAAAVAYATLVAALFVPGTVVETRGVLEATLYDVKTGTLLFTVNERVEAQTNATPLGVEAARDAQQERLVKAGVSRLADSVLGQVRRLVALRPGPHQAVTVDAPR